MKKLVIGLFAVMMAFSVGATTGTGAGGNQSSGPSNGSVNASHSQGIENIKSSYINSTAGQATEAWSKGRIVTRSVFCDMPNYVAKCDK
ncbi:hypothetical protein KMC32_gp098 [Shigella phage JK45]|uniref:Uncharacterized protein n=3 Tax=Mosigvirus TaxID=1913652 RepID=A0A5B9N3E6_9CAUD|nr:hypothetical protein KMC32_gp098 [Shigella phage JK45]AWM11882.1 hypothetical protein vBEcoMNBG1_096 [Escherichia phage vB_EcoM_NBG1]QEG06214.1 hypothetical protein JK42_00096 [Shigella phage JK42]QEG06487.1 hypothetical protein JK45_00098 [Shigella phage JK45]